MAEFYWVQAPEFGGCTTCGSSSSDRGFVHCFAEVNIKRGVEIVGNVDIIICGYCLEQAARLVGSATNQETMDMAQRMMDLDAENFKLKDEVAARDQRYQNLLDRLSEPDKVLGNGNPASHASHSTPAIPTPESGAESAADAVVERSVQKRKSVASRKK